MKKIFLAIGLLFAMSVSQAATNSFLPTFKNAKTTQNSTLNTIFGSGTIIAGSKAGSTSRWYLFNEINLGYSHSYLGNLRLHSADVGLSAYILSISNAKGFRPFVGIEASAPIYLRVAGSSNSFAAIAGQDGFNNQGSKLLVDTSYHGFGVQLPVVVGLQNRSFYMQAMLGYAYHQISETFYVNDIQNDQFMDNTYQGVIYGVGIGGRMTNVFQMGLRFVMGDLTNTSRAFKEETAESLNSTLRTKDFKERYYRASIVFGYMF